MDKALREKIAQAIYDKWNFSKQEDRLEVAEAILALLPPMLTKDEAETLWACFENESVRRYGKVAKDAPILLKLKAIQEGE